MKVLHELVLLDPNQIEFLGYFEGKRAPMWRCCFTAHLILMDDVFASGYPPKLIKLKLDLNSFYIFGSFYL